MDDVPLRRASCLAALLAACGGDASPPAGAASGSATASSNAGTGAGGEGIGAGGLGAGDGGAATSSGQGGAGGGQGGAGGGSTPPLFDMPMIQDPSTADCQLTNPRAALEDGVLLDVWNVSYRSWESIDGALTPIVIRGYAAKPAGRNADLPAVVQAHGLGGYAEESHATGLAALLGAFVVAYTGPGGGTTAENTSEGLASGHDNGRRMFDTIPDTRGSWFWGHAVAGMRGLTCLAARPEVDAARMGFTGFSAGAVATLIAAGVDDRVQAAVPLSGTHAWSVADESPAAWQHSLLSLAGLTTESPEWVKLQDDLIEPAATVAHAAAKVLMVDGSTDEFFPITAFLATYAAIPGSDKRASLSGNFDHGCYVLTGVEAASTIEARAALHAEGGQRMWFGHWFGTSADYAHLPAEPTVTLTSLGAATLVSATVDPGGAALEVDEVQIWWSNDDAFLWGNVSLSEVGDGLYGDVVAFPLQANTSYYVDVTYKTHALLAPERFAISSPPSFPAGFVLHIRDVQTCL